MGDVIGDFPIEIPQVTLDGQARIVGPQHGRGLDRLLGTPQLRQRRRPDAEHLEMVGIDVQGFARPRQRSVDEQLDYLKRKGRRAV